MQNSIETLTKRTRRLEFACILLFMLVVAVGLAVLPHRSAPADALRASAFELYDASGVVRAELFLQDNHPRLHLKDTDGVDRIALFHDSESSGMFVSDKTGVTRIGIAQFAHGGGGVALHGAESKGAAVLYLKNKGSLRFFDHDGNVTNEFLAEK